jgi:hypothetical protein
MSNEVKRSEWITFAAMIVVAILGATSSFLLRYLETRDRIRHEVLEERKSALFDALKVIDHVYANSSFSASPPLGQSKWDIQLARDAMNKMLIYCGKPEQTVETFIKAVGITNPATESVRTYSASDVNLFRKEVARELGVPVAKYDSNRAWIYMLPGTVEESIVRARGYSMRPRAGSDSR